MGAVFKLLPVEDLPACLVDYPAMLTLDDKQVYYQCARDRDRFDGTIVDLGVFVGGSTACLVQGTLDNSNGHKAERPLVRAYDRFEAEWSSVEPLKYIAPSGAFKMGSDFRFVFERQLGSYLQYVNVKHGDAMTATYDEGRPIDILGVDICKNRALCARVTSQFFPHLRVGSLVLQQDYIHPWLPDLYVAMGYFADKFESNCSPG